VQSIIARSGRGCVRTMGFTPRERRGIDTSGGTSLTSLGALGRRGMLL
jgi:hypothetical protein